LVGQYSAEVGAGRVAGTNVLRALRQDGRYEWKEGDAFLKKLPDIIKQYDAGEEEKKKTAKK
jgi:hypothetical protein